jgi:hypothetical protein
VRNDLSDRLMYALLLLSGLILVGMLISSWRVVLYPFLLIMGISILFGFRSDSRGPGAWLMAGGVVLAFGVVFGVVDFLSGGEPTGSTNYVLGMTPVTAIYLISIPVLVMLVGLLYALSFTREDLPVESESSPERPAE